MELFVCTGGLLEPKHLYNKVKLMTRNYRDEYDNYHSSPEQRRRRSSRNKARRKAMKLGKVRKGDGKDVDHVNGDPMDNNSKNLKAKAASKNRSFRRDARARKRLGSA